MFHWFGFAICEHPLIISWKLNQMLADNVCSYLFLTLRLSVYSTYSIFTITKVGKADNVVIYTQFDMPVIEIGRFWTHMGKLTSKLLVLYHGEIWL